MSTTPLGCCTSSQEESITSSQPLLVEVVDKIVLKIEMLIEDAKRYIYIAQMIRSKDPLKKAEKMMRKIKRKVKKRPH